MMVRPAEVSDAGAIAALVNPVIQNTTISFSTVLKTEDAIAADIASAPCFLVAKDGDDLLGFVSYAQFRKGDGYSRAMEHSIVIDPSTRGRGVGRKLIAAAEERARASGVGSLWAGVSGENLDGIRFHAKLGFEEVARLPKVGHKFDRWLDLVLMRKWLLGDER